jgi:AcrR family transcriptional regulator
MKSISTGYLEPARAAGSDPATPARFPTEPRNGYRPRPATIERSREIREIAARYIAEQGLWRFSMLSLARHLNCLLPTLCYYYKKREELITDIVLRHVENLRARTGLAMDQAEDDSPASELHAFAREYLLVALAEQDFHRLMLHFGDLAGPKEGREFVERHESLREIVECRLTAHAPTLGGKPETARALSRAVLDMLNGAATWLQPYGVVKPVGYAAIVTDWVLAQAALS